MSIPNDEKLINGHWKNGELTGNVQITYSGGSAIYLGGVMTGFRHGHGVLRGLHSHSTYAGCWNRDMKHGYGIDSDQREVYLGEFQQNKRQGKGTLVNLDGIYCDGIFENGQLTKGILQLSDGTIFEGLFTSADGNVKGKGQLTLASGDIISGEFDGNIYAGLLDINGKYQKHKLSFAESPTQAHALERYDMLESKIETSHYVYPIEERWIDILFSWFSDCLGVIGLPIPSPMLNPDEIKSAASTFFDYTTVESTNSNSFKNCDQLFQFIAVNVGTDHLWDRIAAVTYQSKVRNDSSIDNLEKIPPWDMPFGKQYINMVFEYVELALKCQYHPLRKLYNGQSDVFAVSYERNSEHKLILPQAIRELHLHIKRFYSVVRLLFPSLPSVSEFADENSIEGSENESFASNVADEKTISMKNETQITQYRNSSIFLYISNRYYHSLYGTISTLYQVTHQKDDYIYWKNIEHCNLKYDVQLLSDFGVQKSLWPVELRESENPMNVAALLAKAKGEYFKSAIHQMQKLGTVPEPIEKLKCLVETFDEINKCVKIHSERKSTKMWSMDDLFPVVQFVMVRAMIQHLGAELIMIHDFKELNKELGINRYSSYFGSEMEHMFTTIVACYYHIIAQSHKTMGH